MLETLTGRIITHALALVFGAFLCIIAVHSELSDNFWTIAATCIIALFTVFTVIVQAYAVQHQKITAKASWKASLHRHRISIYETFSTLPITVQTCLDGSEYAAIKEASEAASAATFYFPEHEAKFFNEILEKSRRYHLVQISFNAATNNLNVSQKEMKDLERELIDLESWLNNSSSREALRNRLSDYLTLPDEL